MISIKKFLGEDETGEALPRVLQVLLQGMGSHVVEGSPTDYERLRSAFEKAEHGFSAATGASEALVEAGAIIRALDEYNRRTSRLLRQRRTELETMVRMLTETVQSVAAESGESVLRLKQIEDQISAATHLEDVRALRVMLAGCLAGIREEAALRRQEGDRAGKVLRGEIADRPPEKVDTVTGLADRTGAEEALVALIGGQCIAFAAVLVLDRVQNYNAAFGIAAGDDVLKHFAEFVDEQLRPGWKEYRLFRWTGPAFLLLLEKVSRVETLREDLAALLAQPLEHEVRAANRAIRLPIVSRWTLLPMMSAPRLLIQRIDNFVASPNKPDL